MFGKPGVYNMSVLIIDYGMGNLRSVKRAFEECGADVVISDDPGELDIAERFVLPGVGAFVDGMNNLREMGWIPAIRNAVFNHKIPMLGICLGMQLLAQTGFENGNTPGLGLIPGEVIRLEPDSPGVRIPHVGWNEVHKKKESKIISGIPDGSDFYFVHSYHFVPAKGKYTVAATPYCGGFVSVIENENIYGVQFHPEKSHRLGFRIISNFLQS